MKVKVTRKVTEELEIGIVSIGIPIDEIGMHDPGVPGELIERFRKGDLWWLDVNVDTGRVERWPAETPLDLYCKPRDGGEYKLLAPDGKVIAEIDQCYVPNRVIPGDYGDYVDLKIDDKGIVTNWPKEPDFKAFFGGGEDD